MAIIRYSPFTGVEPFPGLTAFQDTMNQTVRGAERPPVGPTGGYC